MGRKLGIVGVALALGVMAFGLGAASGAPDITAPVTVTVIEHSLHDTVVDVGTKGDSTGDLLTFHNDVFDATNTTKAGKDNGYCVREDPSAGTWECMWTTFLPGGRVTAEGLYSDTAPKDLFAVTGGTGVYKNARGTVVETSGPGTDEFTLVFKLIP